jgi:hypothetical protein
MLLILAFVVTLYLVCFLWFRSQCRSAIRTYESSREQTHGSNLIPFERGLKPRIHKAPHAV